MHVGSRMTIDPCIPTMPGRGGKHGTTPGSNTFCSVGCCLPHSGYGSGPSIVLVCASRKMRHYSGIRHYSAHCHCWLFPYMSSVDFTVTTADNRHYGDHYYCRCFRPPSFVLCRTFNNRTCGRYIWSMALLIFFCSCRSCYKRTYACAYVGAPPRARS